MDPTHPRGRWATPTGYKRTVSSLVPASRDGCLIKVAAEGILHILSDI